MKWIDTTPLALFVVIALTLGLAPFTPEPHVWQKLKMLWDGTLAKPLDIFDLVLHGAPWLVLGIKLGRILTGRTG
jgi:hypothetical protein